MKTLEHSERQLAAWTPRPPSASLHKRLFGPPTVAPSRQALNWPSLFALSATSLALFTLVFTPARRADPFLAPTTPRWTILAASNQWLASYFVADPSTPRNSPPLQRFEWTNLNPSPSSSVLPR
jgi:hypothetical protein